jgi:uncharacterized membrane protein YphA (DoxX/SURF4 family)
MHAHAVDVGVLLLRVVTGLLWCGHGTQKLFGWFGAKRRGTLEPSSATSATTRRCCSDTSPGRPS